MSEQNWLFIELQPLPLSEYEASFVFWNPDEGLLAGEGKDLVLEIVGEVLNKGLPQEMPYIEITDPLKKPTELAAILGQYFWVIPQPVNGSMQSGIEVSLQKQ